jgi:hypothetical protein
MREGIVKTTAKFAVHIANKCLSPTGREIGVAYSNGKATPVLRHTLRLDPRQDAALDPKLKEATFWRFDDRHATANALTSSELGRIWKETPGGHKWLNYFPIYEELFSRFRYTEPKVLEIGVYKGASLKLWQTYFGPGTHVVGVDIDAECKRFEDANRSITVRIGSQADSAFLRSLVDEFGMFDIIIDDGSHMVDHQITSFNALFGDGLKAGGIYFVEDLECYFWKDSSCRSQPSFISFAAHLAHMMHMHYNKYDYNDFSISNLNAPVFYKVPYITTILGSIRIHNSLVSFQKCSNIPPIVQLL